MSNENNLSISSNPNITGHDIYVSSPDTSLAIEASNNKSRYFAELAESYKNKAKEYMDNARYYSEQNSDVSMAYIDELEVTLRNLINTKQAAGNYALSTDIPTKVSDLENDSNFLTTVPTATASTLGLVKPDGTTININNGILSANIASRNLGEIVTSTIPLTDAGLHLLDGSLLSGSGSYADFVDYIANLYSNLPATTYQSNVTKVGSLTDNNCVLSGFSSSNYTQTPQSFAPANNPWEIVFKVTTGNDLSGYHQFCVTDSIQSVLFCINDSHLVFSIGNGTGWVTTPEITGATTLSTNTTYYFKLVYTGSTYTSYSSTNGIDWTIEGSTTLSNTVPSGVLNIGVGRTYTLPFGGSIDLKESYININNTRWWDGATATLSPFCTEAEWQNSVTANGVCGKFVYDSVNNTVRLPKYSNKIYSSLNSGVPVAGNGLTLGLTDGSNNYGLQVGSDTYNYAILAAGNYNKRVGTAKTTAPTINLSLGITTDEKKSGIVAQLSNISTSLDGYYYIVVATSTKTDIQVDIDEIATDLNGKADVDLSNVSNTSGFRKLAEVYNNGSSWYKVFREYNPSTGDYIGLWCEQGGVDSKTHLGAVTLLKNYADTNYSVQLTTNDTASTNYSYVSCYNKSVSGFNVSIVKSNSGISATVCWQASGYIS